MKRNWMAWSIRIPQLKLTDQGGTKNKLKASSTQEKKIKVLFANEGFEFISLTEQECFREHLENSKNASNNALKVRRTENHVPKEQGKKESLDLLILCPIANSVVDGDTYKIPSGPQELFTGKLATKIFRIP